MNSFAILPGGRGNLPTGRTLQFTQRNSTFSHNRILPLIAFRDLVANKIPERFPGLRFGFIEASAGWIPFLIHVLRRLLRERWKFASTAELFREYRLYVACEDILYIAKHGVRIISS